MLSFSIKCCLLLLIFISHNLVVISPLPQKSKNDDPESDDEYGEELDSITTSFNHINNLYNTKQVDYFSKIYSKTDEQDISANIANLMKCDMNSKKSFLKLNDIANKVLNGDVKLKANGQLKSTLKMMLNDSKMKLPCRVRAAQLAARLNDIPVTIQTINPDLNKKAPDSNSYIIVPRIKRLFRPDYYIENYKAGNWDA